MNRRDPREGKRGPIEESWQKEHQGGCVHGDGILLTGNNGREKEESVLQARGWVGQAEGQEPLPKRQGRCFLPRMGDPQRQAVGDLFG